LDVSRQEKGAGFDYKYPKSDVLGTAIELICDVTAEHSGPDNDDIEGVTTVVADFSPGTANPPTQHVVGELSLLDINESIRIGVEARQHLSPLCCFRVVPVRARMKAFGSASLQWRGFHRAFDLGAFFVQAPRRVSGAATTEHNRYLYGLCEVGHKIQTRHQDTLRGNRHANDHEYCSSCYSVFAASPLEHALNNRAVASSIALNNKSARKIFLQRYVRASTTSA